MACKRHICRNCLGSGDVCPTCQGMRFVRTDEADAANNWFVEIERCPTCWDKAKNAVDAVRERRAIDRYLVRYRYEQGAPATTAAAIPVSPALDKLDMALAESRANARGSHT